MATIEGAATASPGEVGLHTPRICLSMIVRDEAQVIERCLEAAAPLLDGAVVVDTGSTDDTPERIRCWMEERGLPHRVVSQPWRDFGHNRTAALRDAQDAVRSWGWEPARTYLLFLDADMVVSIGDGFRVTELTADAYRVVQRNADLSYPNLRLARADLELRYVGATHEYLELPAEATQEVLNGLRIGDRNDGGSRGDKLERDERLLLAELERDPGDPRTLFYLAQTYRGLERPELALALYRRRTEAGGWHEEVWYSWYMMGRIWAEAGDLRPAVHAYVRAIRIDPERAEAWFFLSQALRCLGRHLAATRCALAGRRLPLPGGRSLFLEPGLYGDAFDQELSISAYSTPWRERGFEAAERLALGSGVAPATAALAARNELFYAESLPGVVYHSLRPRLSAGFSPCNPSIVRTADGHLVSCRAVDYRIGSDQRYLTAEPGGAIRTRNVLMHLDRDLTALGEQEIVVDAPPLREARIRGVEDLRLVVHDERLWATGSSWDHVPGDRVGIVLLALSEEGVVESRLPLRGFHDDLHQKNWLPFSDPDSGELRAVYGHEPWTVVAIDPATGGVQPRIERRQGRPFHRWRGSAGPVPLPDHAGGGWLLVVHEVVWLDGFRYYLHRLVRLDGDGIVAASRPFWFLQRGIEFVCGACLAHDGRRLLLGLGVHDGSAWVVEMPLEAALDHLRRLP